MVAFCLPSCEFCTWCVLPWWTFSLTDVCREFVFMLTPSQSCVMNVASLAWMPCWKKFSFLFMSLCLRLHYFSLYSLVRVVVVCSLYDVLLVLFVRKSTRRPLVQWTTYFCANWEKMPFCDQTWLWCVPEGKCYCFDFWWRTKISIWKVQTMGSRLSSTSSWTHHGRRRKDFQWEEAREFSFMWCSQVASNENGQEVHSPSSSWKHTQGWDVFKWDCWYASSIWLLQKWC